MHPLEQLRYLARGWGAGEDFPVQEAASVLADLVSISPGALLQACRRLIDYFPGCGAAWWLSSRALSAPDPVAGIWDAATELDDDPTFEQLAAGLPHAQPVALVHPPRALSVALARRPGVTTQKKFRSAAVVVVVAQAAGGDRALVGTRAAEAVRMAAAHQAQLWLAVPRGALLPSALWEHLLARCAPDPSSLVEAGQVATAIGEQGQGPLAKVLAGPSCPPAAELLGWSL